MKARVEAVIVGVLLALCAAERAQDPFPPGTPAPPKQLRRVRRRRSPAECPEPVCPQPVCPQPSCLPAHCSPCPACPDCHPANVSCPQPVCPPAVCPRPSCPPPSCPSAQQACPAKAAACSGCLWKVLVTYDHFQGMGFYKAFKTKVDWHQAQALCAADGAHLAVINSDKEADILKLLYQKYQLTDWTLIGIHNLDEEKWKTVTGELLSNSGYLKWQPGEPSGGDEHCGTINSLALMNDIRCYGKYEYICEVSEEVAFGQ